MPITELKQWFLAEKRDLPWRRDPSPYRVWISEVMLQQTQASVVIPYFEQWMHQFPSIAALAAASEQEVMKIWEGLGYYSRARHLRLAAIEIMERHGGVLPDKREELEKIKGLGPYTVGAILSFAFHQKAFAIDGNVKRVISRYAYIEEDITSRSAQKKIEMTVEKLLPDKEPWTVMEALIELGATVCKRTPLCYRCPLQADCLAFTKGSAENLPYKERKTVYVPLERWVAIIACGKEVLIRQEQPGKVMAGLYEFPYFEKNPSQKDLFGLPVEEKAVLSPLKQTFTRYRVQLYPAVWEAKAKGVVPGFEWMPFSELLRLPFSSGHRRILLQCLRHAYFTY